ncbi:MAG TPA: double-strand break repair helicase AddA [Xanthobacteraceae bacterium]|nr:double-strand break repair helicase AddA [Xanthobacteraceae bacterium]
MVTPFEVPPDTLKRQEEVSNPEASAWVSANAGAGKTTVLVRRVIRLLLDGNPPAKILCLTFTKAAASNMANKVLERLATWVRLDDAALDAEIRKTSPRAPDAALRATARRLFAQALETPGGLKVQTIHAFCDRVLHQFPVEARVQAGFEVLDGTQEAALLDRARERVLIEAAEQPDGALGRALATAVASASDDSFGKALAEAVRGRRKVARLIELGGAAEVARALGLKAADNVESIVDEILQGGEVARGEWPGIASALLSLGGNAAGCGEQLLHAARVGDTAGAAEAHLAVFFTGKGEPRADSGFGAGTARAARPELFAQIFAERDRLIPLRDRLFAAQAAERTAALLTLADAAIERFEEEKRRRGALDYADLIEKTADMLRDTGSAWVLYKLDGGIDHLLIDEAQDTSPEQWSVIEKLTEEFFAGHGARTARPRTVFAVGDEKQSIFSFQGAEPQKFEEMRQAFQRRTEDAGAEFRSRKLDLSFRSARGVLAAVDTVFAQGAAFKGLTSGEEMNTVHEAIRQSAPALIEVWPTEKPAKDAENLEPWDAPVDARSAVSPVARLAQRIARAMKLWTEGGLVIEDRDTKALRAATPGDAIVLVRRRGPLFDAILQALKQADVAVAGADRLKLAEHIAVMDLMALGDALLLDADDLSLACTLKSPLFELTEDDLYALAHERKASLAASLAANAGADPHFAAASEKLARWRAEARALRPFDFYSRLLGRDGGREAMLARLGPEAADAIDEFLAQALAYERTETPSLVGFLHFLRRAGTEVKRDLEVESRAVRVMTVHGAKGLEAPLVVLADTTTLPDGREERLHALPGSELFVWAGRKDFDSSKQRAARDAATAAREAEYRRLLYVALTRAADALILCGAENQQQKKSGPPDGSWYRLVRDALEAELLPTKADYADEDVLRWRPEPARAAERQAPAPEKKTAEIVPWLRAAAATQRPATRPIAPSQLDPDNEPLSPYARTAPAIDPRLRGDLVHRLLHRLPDVASDERRNAALAFLASVAPELPAANHASLTDEAIRVIEHPDLVELFAAGSRAEVDVLAHGSIENGREISGRIDRLAVSEKHVTVADFKTGRAPAKDAAPPGNYLRQLAVYRDVLARIYPNRAMRCLLIWTESAEIHEIPAETLEAASSTVFTET